MGPDREVTGQGERKVIPPKLAGFATVGIAWRPPAYHGEADACSPSTSLCPSADRPNARGGRARPLPEAPRKAPRCGYIPSNAG